MSSVPFPGLADAEVALHKTALREGAARVRTQLVISAGRRLRWWRFREPEFRGTACFLHQLGRIF
jgi:hypothetical protein